MSWNSYPYQSPNQPPIPAPYHWPQTQFHPGLFQPQQAPVLAPATYGVPYDQYSMNPPPQYQNYQQNWPAESPLPMGYGLPHQMPQPQPIGGQIGPRNGPPATHSTPVLNAVTRWLAAQLLSQMRNPLAQTVPASRIMVQQQLQSANLMAQMTFQGRQPPAVPTQVLPVVQPQMKQPIHCQQILPQAPVVVPQPKAEDSSAQATASLHSLPPNHNGTATGLQSHSLPSLTQPITKKSSSQTPPESSQLTDTLPGTTVQPLNLLIDQSKANSSIPLPLIPQLTQATTESITPVAPTVMEIRKVPKMKLILPRKSSPRPPITLLKGVKSQNGVRTLVSCGPTEGSYDRLRRNGNVPYMAQIKIKQEPWDDRMPSDNSLISLDQVPCSSSSLGDATGTKKASSSLVPVDPHALSEQRLREGEEKTRKRSLKRVLKGQKGVRHLKTVPETKENRIKRLKRSLERGGGPPTPPALQDFRAVKMERIEDEDKEMDNTVDDVPVTLFEWSSERPAEEKEEEDVHNRNDRAESMDTISFSACDTRSSVFFSDSISSFDDKNEEDEEMKGGEEIFCPGEEMNEYDRADIESAAREKAALLSWYKKEENPSWLASAEELRAEFCNNSGDEEEEFLIMPSSPDHE